MGVAATVAPKGLGPQDPTKKLAHWVEMIGQPLSGYLENLFSKISGLHLFIIMIIILKIRYCNIIKIRYCSTKVHTVTHGIQGQMSILRNLVK